MNAKHASCFVIMPFSATSHRQHGTDVTITKPQWDHIYEHWIKKAVESFQGGKFSCKRSPSQPGNFVKGIIADLSGSDIVIADLTGGNGHDVATQPLDSFQLRCDLPQSVE